MRRKIISIDEEKCDGCGLCVPACHEGALQLVDGKARLVKESFCDGLGDCLGECPRGAITIEEREAEAFDPEAVGEGAPVGAEEPLPCGCPGIMTRRIERRHGQAVGAGGDGRDGARPSRLSQWPVQLRLLNPSAPYWDGADLLVAADCVLAAYGPFQEELLAGRKLVMACPKLDETSGYAEKLASILRENDIRSVTVARMEVPCCSGIVALVEEALRSSGKVIPYRRMVIGIDGEVRERS